MNVLSLFDGISSGQLALNKAGIKYNYYYASEIDKFSMMVTQKRFPKTIQLGDINNWKSWKKYLPKIDLLLAGSPCQGFSNAGTMLNFKDERSKLFFVFLEIMKDLNPDYFLLENVKMKKEWVNIITDFVKVQPILINSALVSAQNRERYYWTNIPGIEQPNDRHIFLKDILISGNPIGEKSYCIDSNYYKGGSIKNHGENFKSLKQSERRMQVIDNPIVVHGAYSVQEGGYPRTYIDKSPTITTPSGGTQIPYFLEIEKLSHSKEALKYMDRKTSDGRNHWDFNHHSDIKNEKSSAVVANFVKGIPFNVLKDGKIIRKFHPIEVERLQTVPDNYTKVRGVSDTQRYKMLGNGWTVEVIAHILTYLKKDKEK